MKILGTPLVVVQKEIKENEKKTETLSTRISETTGMI